jgi:hypothetical protein
LKQSRHKDYEKVIKFPIFSHYKVHIIFSDDIRKSKKVRYGSDEFADGASAVHCHDSDGHSHCIYDIGKSCTGTIAHESWHAVWAMLKWAGVEIENEVVAYHLGYIVQATTDFWTGVPGFKPSSKSRSRK